MPTIAQRFEQLIDCDHQVDWSGLCCDKCGQLAIDVRMADGG